MGSFGGGKRTLAFSAASLSKVEIFTNPGTYDSSKSKFENWWTKMQAWLDCNPKRFAYTDIDGDEIINEKNCTYTILSRLCSVKGSHFTEVELQNLQPKIPISMIGKHLSWR